MPWLRCDLGRVLALDPGTKRIGVAVTDPLRMVATPVEVVERGPRYLDRIRSLVDEYQPDVIVVGLPVDLSGNEGPAAADARAFASEVAEATGLHIELIDERFTTVTAEGALTEGGVRRRDRRRKVDKVAASLILRHYLDRESSKGFDE